MYSNLFLGKLSKHGNSRIHTVTTAKRITSKAIQLTVITLAIIPFFLWPLELWVNLDPFLYTFSKIISTSQVCGSTSNLFCNFIVQLIIFLLRAICVFICDFEASRFFAVLFCMLIYIIELVVGCLEILNQTQVARDLYYNNLSFSKEYMALQITHKTLYKYVCSLFVLIMGDGFLIILCCNLATIRAYDLLPIQVYWLMPVVSIMFSFIIAFVLHFAVKVHESSTRMIYARKIMLGNNRCLVNAAMRKLDRSEIVATRPIAFSCGKLYDLKRGAESTYFYFIFLKTMDGLLLQI